MRLNPTVMMLFAPMKRTRTLLIPKSLTMKVMTPTNLTSLLREEEGMILTLTRA